TARMRADRPDLWAAWSADVRQHIACERLVEARLIATEATERFPLVARAWLDRADVARAAEDLDGERHALEQAVAVAPLDPTGVARLAAALEQDGQIARALALLERASAVAPAHAGLALCVSGLMWRSGDRDLALERTRRLIALDPEAERA